MVVYCLLIPICGLFLLRTSAIQVNLIALGLASVVYSLLTFIYQQIRCTASRPVMQGIENGRDLTKIFNPLWEFFFQVKKKKLSYLKNKLSYLEKFRLVMCNSYQGVVRKIPVLVQKIPSLGRKSTTLGIGERREER